MGPIPFITSLTASAFLSSIATSALADMSAQERNTLFYEAYSQNDADVLDGLLGDDWISAPMVPKGQNGLTLVKPKMADVQDLRLQGNDVLVIGNKIIVRSTFTATLDAHTPAEVMAMEIHEFNENGLIVQSWPLEDWLMSVIQVGAFDV